MQGVFRPQAPQRRSEFYVRVPPRVERVLEKSGDTHWKAHVVQSSMDGQSCKLSAASKTTEDHTTRARRSALHRWDKRHVQLLDYDYLAAAARSTEQTCDEREKPDMTFDHVIEEGER